MSDFQILFAGIICFAFLLAFGLSSLQKDIDQLKRDVKMIKIKLGMPIDE